MNVAVIIPSYNASASLPALLKRTVPIVSKEQIIVVNDGSKDETAAIALQYGVTVLSHDKNYGKGAALKTGFKYVLAHQFDASVTMDADLQHEPEMIPSFINKYAEGKFDVVIGSRVFNTATMPVHRFLSNTITSALVRLRTGASIPDSQSGFRLLSRKVLELVELESTGFEAETELLIKAAVSGCSFTSVPIKTIYSGEKSNMTHLHTTIQFIRVLLKRY
ncbi:MAG: glycosyltransferase family 2 protein [Bacteriovoracaceae bacterium]|nr:glycosyltransferase family 2 protein [Bacteroidota bacterium]